MTRLTEYHHGVAVIKGKRFKEAAAKLAWLEDWEEHLNEEQFAEFRKYLEKKAVKNNA